MSKMFLKILSIVLVLVLAMSSMPLAMAADNASDSPLKIEIETNKSSYSSLDIANFTVSITNVSDAIVENISAEALFDNIIPVGRTSEIVKEIDTLGAGESIEFSFKAMLDTSSVSVSFFEKLIVGIIRFFIGTVAVKDNGFDDGRSLSYAESMLSFGNNDVCCCINVWFNNKSFLLTSSEKEFETSESETIVYFYAQPTDIATTVYLTNENGDKITEMLDDGAYSSSGDDMVNDGVYSAKLSLNSTSEVNLVFRAIAVNEQGDIVKSSNSCEIHIYIYEPITDEQIMAMNETDAIINELIQSDDFMSLSYDNKSNLVNELLIDLEDKGYLKEDTIIFDEDSGVYGFEYSCGILGGISISEFDPEMNGIKYRNANLSESIIEESVTLQSVDSIGSLGDAKILFSFNLPTDDSSFRRPFYQNTEDSWDSNGLDTNVDWSVTVSDLKNLDNDYEVICLSGHGSTYSNQPVLCLSEVVTTQNQKNYSADLKQRRLARVNIGGKQYYWVFPALITDTYDSNSLSGSFIFSECCCFFGESGNYTNAFSNAFLNVGASAIVGFHNSVLAVYCRDFMKTWIDSLIEGKTAREAYNIAINKYGSTDGQLTDAAVAQFRGDSDAKLIETGIKNGGFEDSVMPVYWSYEGDVRIVSGLGSLKPQKGTKMAILTTGIGSKESDYLAGTEGSILQQTFIVPNGAKTLSFEYDVVSEEPLEYVGSKYDDKFMMQIFDENGILIDQIAYETINTSEWYSIEGINFDGGDNTTYHTGWKSASTNISKYENQKITVRYIIYDVGDSVYDTATLVDNIVINQ